MVLKCLFFVPSFLVDTHTFSAREAGKFGIRPSITVIVLKCLFVFRTEFSG